MLVSPGFINTHAHIGVELMAPFVDIPPSGASRGRYAPSEECAARREQPPSLSPEEQQLSGEFSLLQMLKCGATTIVDAAGSGPLWWLGNPPADEEMLLDTAARVGAHRVGSHAAEQPAVGAAGAARHGDPGSGAHARGLWLQRAG
jgi:cytosine/adenosine deaminase-related metal-dependent hydrolase